MNLKKMGTMAGAILVSGALITGVAFAAEATTTTPPAASTETKAAVPATSQLTEGEKDIFTKLQELRKTYKDKLTADSKALVDGAVTEGKITQEQGDRLLQHGGKGGPGGKGFGRGGKHGFGGERGGKHAGLGAGFLGDFESLTTEALKAKLDAAVAEGKITQDQADKIAAHHAEHLARENAKTEESK